MDHGQSMDTWGETGNRSSDHLSQGQPLPPLAIQICGGCQFPRYLMCLPFLIQKEKPHWTYHKGRREKWVTSSFNGSQADTAAESADTPPPQTYTHYSHTHVATTLNALTCRRLWQSAFSHICADDANQSLTIIKLNELSELLIHLTLTT